MVCTFFGHRNCPLTVKEKLREVLVELIEHRGVDRFTVGRQGRMEAGAVSARLCRVWCEGG